jgi:predicted AlkP superfamily pyrophosphatase or phosphodiesterase
VTRVAFFMLDGVRPDALTAAKCPAITGLMRRGAATLQATGVMPCITLPSHTSIFHSVPPERHGVTSNDWQPMARPVPGLFEVAHAAGLRTAFLYNWEPLRDLARPGSLDAAFFRSSQHERDGDDITAIAARQVLGRDRPDFIFIYFGTVDAVGHDYGWMSADYLAQLERVDVGLGSVLAELGDDCAVVVQADHGGHDRDHGEPIPEDLTVPWLVAGPGIRRGHRITQPVTHLDTAPTIARLLGLAPAPQWEGRCVEEIFAASAEAGA